MDEKKKADKFKSTYEVRETRSDSGLIYASIFLRRPKTSIEWRRQKLRTVAMRRRVR